MVVKSIGTIGNRAASAIWFRKEVNSGIVYFPLKSSTARIPSAMKSSAQPKTG